MNILITGGNGYIAKSLSKGLWKGSNRYNITSITRNDFDLSNREATNKWFEGKHFDVIIHTAVVGDSAVQKYVSYIPQRKQKKAACCCLLYPPQTKAKRRYIVRVFVVRHHRRVS